LSGDIEAIGAMATAGLAAHALDDSGADPRPAHGVCANCGTALEGHYCHACGQAGHVHRTVGHIFEEFLHGLYHFDSKAWRTLPLLVFRPGRLTRDYVYGKRARYIAPLALFLLTVFLMFFVFGLLGGPSIGGGSQQATPDAPRIARSRQRVIEASAGIIGPNIELAAGRRDSGTSPAELAALAATAAAAQRRLGVATADLKQAATATGAKSADKVTVTTDWQDDLRRAAQSGRVIPNSGSALVNARIKEAALDPAFALYKIEQKAYKLSFLLVPLSLPTLWLLFFWRRGVTLYDHTVFALYSLSFMSLLFVAGALVLKLGSDAMVGPVALVLTVVPLIHMYAQLKGAYQLGRGGALVRTMILGFSSLLTLCLFAAIIVVSGLAS
jgi:hypothetical protein